MTCAALAGDLAAQGWEQGRWLAPFDHPNDPAGPATSATTVSIEGAPPTSACVPAWDSNTPYTLNAIHAALIVKGPKRGRLFVFGEPYIQAFLASGGTVLPPEPPLPRQIHWAILDPITGAAENFCANLPVGKGDLFCAGIAITATGDVLVVGGTMCHEFVAGAPPCTNTFTGSVLAYLWQPPTTSGFTDGGIWTQQDDLDEPRWYPSITALGPDPITDEDRMMISGATSPGPDPANALRSYQVWRPGHPPGVGLQWQTSTQGPPLDHTFPDAGGSFMPLENYPRGILLPGINDDPNQLARVVFAGWPELTDRVSHYLLPGGTLGAWERDLTWSMSAYRRNGSALLLARTVGMPDSTTTVFVNGGLDLRLPAGMQILGSIQLSRANLGAGPSPTGRDWANDEATMIVPRWSHNTVLMPDTRVFSAGGEAEGGSVSEGCSLIPAKTPEIYDRTSGNPATRNRAGADHLRAHDYHGMMLVLPSGEIILGGGESRHRQPCASCPLGCPGETLFPADYEIYQPDYITSPEPGDPVFDRPVIQVPLMPDPPPPNQLAEFVFPYDSQADVYYTMPAGSDATIAKVVLLRPGAVTHHADTNQRCIELNFTRLVNEQTQQTFVRVDIPKKEKGLLPRGIYMLFLVSSQTVVTQGVPSVAAWAHVK